MKIIIPWVCVAALLAGIYFIYSGSQAKDATIAQLRQENAEIPQLRAAGDEAKKIPALSAQLDSLQKDNEDLLRLRNEVRQLRDDNKKVTAQLQKAQSQINSTQTQLNSAQLEQQRLAAAAAENQARADAFGNQLQAQTARAQANACINNLRQIDGAKQQWALEKHKTPGAVPTPADLAPFLPGGAMPVCPAGGVYSINAVGALPTCSVPGHALVPQ